MKIYKYYNGKVHELEVRESAKMYIAEMKSPAFGFKTYFYKKDGIPLTPIEAIQEKNNSLLTMKGALKDRIHKIDSDLGQLRKVEKSYIKQIQVTRKDLHLI